MISTAQTYRGSEDELILQSARTAITPVAAAAIQMIVRQNLAWDRVLQQAVRQGVAPLVYRSLNRLVPTLIPDEVRARLHDCFHSNAARSFLLTAELLKLLAGFENASIKAIPFKGPALAAAAYGDLTLRQFSDIDVLIHRKDLERAMALLFAQGFQPWRHMTEAEEAAHLGSAHAYTFVRDDNIARIDLHWRLTQERYSVGFDPEILWHRLGQVSLGGKLVPTLDAEDLLLVLCIHGSKHGWERLGWICDVAELLRVNPKLRWDEITARSANLHVSRAVFLGLQLAKSLLDAPVPELVLSMIRQDRGLRWVSFWIQRRLFARSRKIGPLEQALLFMMARERVQNKLPHLAYSFRRIVKPSEIDMEVMSLPHVLYFLYYPLRAARLTRIAVARLFSRAH